MTTLENLYYGNIDPANKYIKRGSEYSKLINLSIRNEEKLTPTLSKEQKIIFEKYKDCISEMTSILEKKASYSNGDEYIDWMESAHKFIVDALVKHAIEFGDEYILNGYGLIPVDATKINKLVAQRDKHTLAFFGLENSSNEELKNWNANNLEKLPLVKDFERDFTPINPLLDRVWVIYHPAADKL